MNENNIIDYEQLTNLIEKLVEKKVCKILNNYGVEASSFGKVISLDKTNSDTDGNIQQVIRASVELPDGSIINNLYNASDQILRMGDNVKIYGSQSDMSNRYIGIKYEKEVIQ